MPPAPRRHQDKRAGRQIDQRPVPDPMPLPEVVGRLRRGIRIHGKAVSIRICLPARAAADRKTPAGAVFNAARPTDTGQASLTERKTGWPAAWVARIQRAAVVIAGICSNSEPGNRSPQIKP